jgi:hypothetical protein
MTAAIRDPSVQPCRLAAVAQRDEACASTCPFWEPGGAVLDGRCAFDAVELGGRTPLVMELLELRQRFHEAGVDAHLDELRHTFRRIINEHGLE